MKSAVNHASASSKGDAVYSLPLDLPPALLKPSLTLAYSSAAGMGIEMPYGWALDGIAEIRRPLERAFEKKEEGWDGEWLVAGPGFSGTLKMSRDEDYRYYLRAAEPKFVVADYDKDANTWTLHHDGVTWTLEEQDDGEDTDSGTAWWRAVSMQDGVGNTVAYDYHHDGRIKTICYGGNTETGEAHLVDVSFDYDANAAVRTNARAGFLTEYTNHVTKITVGEHNDARCATSDSGTAQTDTNPLLTQSYDTAQIQIEPSALTTESADSGSESSTTSISPTLSLPNGWYAYDLVFTTTDGLELLTELEREGGFPITTETLATFEYSDFNTSADPERTTRGAPDSLGAFTSFPNCLDDDSGTLLEESYSYTYATLMDFNRDGLPDVVKTEEPTQYPPDAEPLQVIPQAVLHRSSGGIFKWSGDHTVSGDDIGFIQKTHTPLITSESAPYQDVRKSITTKQVLDLDGDGYLDHLTSNDEDEWIVHYGNGSYFNTTTIETPPSGWQYSQIDWLPEGQDDWDNAVSTKKKLIDLNGDDWLDAYDPEEGAVYYHSGERGGGWESVSLMKQKFDAISTAKYTTDSWNYTCSDCDSDSSFGLFKYISRTDEVEGFYDMNGDGLPDHVDASATPWRVALNNGHDFENPVDWTAPTKYMRRSDDGLATIIMSSDESSSTFPGFQTVVYQMLADVDGDGLLDLALGYYFGKEPQDVIKVLTEGYPGRGWYKNTGSGFESASRTLPNFWLNALIVSSAETKIVLTEPGWILGRTYVDGCPLTNSTIQSTMMDADHDGALDYVSVSDGIKYGHYPRPYLLTKVNNGQGGSTELSYRSSATVSPSGDFGTTQNNPVTRHLVDTLATADALTGQSADTAFDYADGYFEDGVFHGFESRSVTQKINDAWAGKSEYAYDLDRDFAPLATTQKTYTDFNLSFGPTLKRGDTSPGVRYKIETTYGDTGDRVEFHLPKTRKVTEYGEAGGEENLSLSYTWDDYGNLTMYKHDGGGDAENAIVAALHYVADSADPDDATFYRMTKKYIAGTDPLLGYNIISSETYYYDDHASTSDLLENGLITRTETASGWAGGGESLTGQTLSIAYERGDRGELKSVTDNATGIKIDQTFGFGGAVLLTQANNLSQKLTRELDSHGRVKTITDDNGMSIAFSYDAFNRVTAKTVTGSDGTIYPYKTADYARTTAPYYTTTKFFKESGAVDTTAYALEDGFGRAASTWAQDADGHFLAATEIFDPRGLSTGTGHPVDKGTSFTAPSSFEIALWNKFGRSYYDALGAKRETVRDAHAGTGSQLVYFDSPRLELRQDEAGYQTRITYDAHYRVIKVAQGKSGLFTTTAEYSYDPLDRLVKYTDGGGTVYAYSYDGAGRLRRVMYGSASSSSTAVSSPTTEVTSTTSSSWFPDFTAALSSAGSMTTWHNYDYTGLLMTKRTDAGGGSAAWEYDEIGRPKTMTITDSLPSSTGTLAYAWDYDDVWAGAVYQTTDPAGTITYAYDALGRVKSAKRAYNASTTSTSGKTAKFSYAYDLAGNVTSTTLPSYRVITATYDYGHLTGESVAKSKISTTADYTLAYDYNKWGLIETATSSLGHEYSNTYTTPLWVDAVAVATGGTTYKRAYKWLSNGLLSQRRSSSSASSVTLATTSYTYNNLRELTGASSPIIGTIESYAYDAAGNPTSTQDVSGTTWTYASAGALNQIASRTSDSANESFTYDDAGQLAQWQSSDGTYVYYYDGLGRLRGVTKGGLWQMVLDYDGNGNLARKADNNPFTAKPYYEYVFGAWRYNETNNERTEFDNGFVATSAGDRRWLFKEYDGHTAMTFDDAGAVQMKRSLGAFGGVLSESGTAWDFNSFHGMEDQAGLIQMGRRHLLQGQGQWLQPEPLLYEGIPQESLSDPLGFATYRYARNTPTGFGDRTGMAPFRDRNGTNSEVYRTGNDILIILPIQFEGWAAQEPDFQENVINGIENNWSGQIGSYNVRTQVSIVESEGNIVEFHVENAAGCDSPCTSDAETRSYVQMNNNRAVIEPEPFSSEYDLEYTAAHEAGHLMGLPDQYDAYGTELPYPGHEGTMMGDYGGKVTVEDIDSILLGKSLETGDPALLPSTQTYDTYDF